MDYKLKVYDIFEVGQRKDKDGNPHQEDYIIPLPGQATEADRLFILCDGMGGHDAGEVASETVCQEMSRSALNSREPDQDKVFEAALDAAFRGLDAKDTQALKKMGTTMTYLRLDPQGALVAHMGDSRVYHIRPGMDGPTTQILYKTYDHSLVNDLVRIGELTEEEARTSPRRNIITRAMQPHMDRRPRADKKQISDIQKGDYFYMCSDGMLEEMEDDQIKEIFSAAGGSDPEKVKKLINETRDNKDNHSAFIVHIIDVENMAAHADESSEIIIDEKKVPETNAPDRQAPGSGSSCPPAYKNSMPPASGPVSSCPPAYRNSMPQSSGPMPSFAPAPRVAETAIDSDSQPTEVSSGRKGGMRMHGAVGNKFLLFTIIGIFALALLVLAIFMIVKK